MGENGGEGPGCRHLGRTSAFFLQGAKFCAVCLASFPFISAGKLLIIMAPKLSALILKHSLRKMHPYTDEETEAG